MRQSHTTAPKAACVLLILDRGLGGWIPSLALPFWLFSICLRAIYHFLSFSFFEAGSCYIAQAELQLKILLLLPPECWDYGCTHHAQLITTLQMMRMRHDSKTLDLNFYRTQA
jgi:hypothetical protein